MKKIRTLSLLLLLLSLFTTVDLGLNFCFSLIPELQDGIGTYSVLHVMFGIFGDNGWSRVGFFYAFSKASWTSFWLIAINIALYTYNLVKGNNS